MIPTYLPGIYLPTASTDDNCPPKHCISHTAEVMLLCCHCISKPFTKVRDSIASIVGRFDDSWTVSTASRFSVFLIVICVKSSNPAIQLGTRVEERAWYSWLSFSPLDAWTLILQTTFASASYRRLGSWPSATDYCNYQQKAKEKSGTTQQQGQICKICELRLSCPLRS